MHYLVSVCIVLLATEKASWRAFTDSPDWRETRAFGELAPLCTGREGFRRSSPCFGANHLCQQAGRPCFTRLWATRLMQNPRQGGSPSKLLPKTCKLARGPEKSGKGGREGQTGCGREERRARRTNEAQARRTSAQKNGDGPGRRSGPSPPDAIGVGSATRRGTPCGRRRPPGAPPRCRSS